MTFVKYDRIKADHSFIFQYTVYIFECGVNFAAPVNFISFALYHAFLFIMTYTTKNKILTDVASFFFTEAA